MVPTKRFWFVIALGIPLAGIAAALGQLWLAVVYNAIWVGVAWMTARLAPAAKDLRVRRTYDTVLSVRAQNRIRLWIENDGLERIEGVLRDEPPPGFAATKREFPLVLEPGREIELDYIVTPKERGGDFFRGSFVRMRCPLGLVVRQERLPTEQPVRVYPNVLALREFDLLKQKGRLQEMGIRRSRIRGLGTEFESLREYIQGDDYRKIDWKASARRGDLVVRQYEQEKNQAVVLCIDVGRHMLAEVEGMRKLDHVLDACLMLANAAAFAGDQVGLLVYGAEVKRYLPPRKGRAQIGAIIEAIHDLLAEPLETDSNVAYSYLASRWKRRSLLVAFTEVEDPTAAQNLLTAFGPLARRHYALLARISDPHLRECLEARVQEEGQMYLKTAAKLLNQERQEAGAALSAAGVHTLDSEPQDLAANLVSYYFQVKERSLI